MKHRANSLSLWERAGVRGSLMRRVVVSFSRLLEKHRGKRRQHDIEAPGAAVRGKILGRDTPQVPEAASAVQDGVAVGDLCPETRGRHSQPVMLTRHRREVECGEDAGAGRPALAHQRERAVLPIVAVDPLEARGLKVQGVESGFSPVETVQIRHPALNARMWSVLQQMPVETRVVIPLRSLAELPSHEEQLLARNGVQETEQEAQVREFLPVVARHLLKQRPLSVYDLVVREGQNEVLRVGVQGAKRQLVVMVLAVNRVLSHVAQRVVHPPQIPLHVEAEPAQMDWPADSGPGGRLLGDRPDVRVRLHDVLV